MNTALDLLERRLVAGYAEQSRCYERALRILDGNSPANVAEHSDAWIQELAEVLQDVARSEGQLSQDKAIWESSGGSPGEEFLAILDRVGRQIHSLGALIDGQIAELLARRQRLLPEVDVISKQRRMLDAYGSNCPATYDA